MFSKFERKILRTIFGPVQDENGIWKIRKNHELNELIVNADIVRFIKSRRMTWLGHVMWMDGGILPRRILEWKPMGRRIREDQGKDGLKTLRKTSRRWE